MARSMKGWKWQAVAGVIALNHEDAKAHARNIRRGHPEAAVNTFPCGVRAGGYAFQVLAVVARKRVPSCTCGTAYERGYPDHPKCGYCVYGSNAFNPRTGEYESRGVLIEHQPDDISAANLRAGSMEGLAKRDLEELARMLLEVMREEIEQVARDAADEAVDDLQISR